MCGCVEDLIFTHRPVTTHLQPEERRGWGKPLRGRDLREEMMTLALRNMQQRDLESLLVSNKECN